MDKRSLLFVLALTLSLFCVNYWFRPESSPISQPIPLEEKVVQTQEPPSTASLPVVSSNFYVLENQYQQIVFSSLGGSVAEINLPFYSSTNSKSVVRPIGFDREMLESYSFNDHFPSVPAYAFGKGHIEPTTGGYYPLLRRTVFAEKAAVYLMDPNHYSCHISSEFEDLSRLNYTVTQFEKNKIVFEYADSQRKIIKTYTLSNEATPYCIDCEIKIEGDSRGLWISSGIPDVELISDNFSPSLKYLVQRNQKSQVENPSLPKDTTAFSSMNPTWVSNSNGFFGLIMQPLSENASSFKVSKIAGNMAPTRLSILDSQYDLYPVDSYPGYEVLFKIPQGKLKFRIFAGPLQDSILKNLDERLSEVGPNPKFSLALSFQGWFTFISEPFAKFLFILMKFFYQITHFWGISIILLTIALRIMLYPLNNWSIKSSLKMQEVAPLVTALQEKYKKDPKKAQMETVALYREKGVNPLTGCLPLLIQIPFLIGMFDLLKSAFELRGVPFIPGWIDNLTAPDVVFSWDYPVFFFGTSFHLLPFILGAVMFFQQRLSSPLPKNAALLTDQQKQQRFMGNIMTVVFSVMFYHFPSGLNIYWLSSMALGILQQWITNRKKTKTVVKLR